MKRAIKNFISIGCFLIVLTTQGQAINQSMYKLDDFSYEIATNDWLLKKPTIKARVTKLGNSDIVLGNGLVSRTFRITPNTATTSIKNLVTGEELIRAVKPEAIVMIDSVSYPIGGLIGQPERGYLLNEWLDDMHSPIDAFTLDRFEQKPLTSRMEWGKKRWIPATQWDVSGQELIFYYQHESLDGIVVEVHYQLYDGIPLFAKWLEIINNGNQSITINHFTSELIAHHEAENYVDNPPTWKRPNIYVENDYAFSGFTSIESDNSVVWEADPEYTSQVNWERKMPCLIKSQPKIGPYARLNSGDSFNSFRTFELLLDGSDRERNTLSQRKMYRTLAPWSQENPIFMHLTTTEPKKVKIAIDQCAEVGYEMVILSFGSGLNMEDESEENIRKYKELADYAHGKGIELGGYSLFSSRKIDEKTDVIDLKTGKPGGAKFGNAPCLGSEWGIAYQQKLVNFFEKTGFDLLEHDGPYPGDFCASTDHPGHNGYYDSQYTQWSETTRFYKWLRARGVYTNIPDFYFLSGSNKCGIGYREVNWSLPRAQQIILGRQNIYDGTWTRTPSMGWTFVPLTQYHGGGKAATLEPLSDHLPEYEAHMVQNYGSGVQACYRGPRIYDTRATKELVMEQIDHYKQYRDILNADVIHLRRPDGRDWDGILHVDPRLKTKGYAMLYNPTKNEINRSIQLPLYYTGISDTTVISIDGKTWRKYELNRGYKVELDVMIPANGYLRILVE